VIAPLLRAHYKPLILVLIVTRETRAAGVFIRPQIERAFALG
jgi:hypothetical protein